MPAQLATRTTSALVVEKSGCAVFGHKPKCALFAMRDEFIAHVSAQSWFPARLARRIPRCFRSVARWGLCVGFLNIKPNYLY